MPGQQVQTTTPGMQQAYAVFDSTITTLEGRKKAAVAELESVGMTWRGQASQGYAQAFVPWFDKVNRIIADLETMKQVMRGTSNIYSSTEEGNTTLAMGMARGLDGL